ncbi:MAG: DUF1302 domain-containing protein [Gammaproteobacteria bacterium]|nr:DUF1302 domain-containing protein [Gammaproteobacteria bacterium]MCY4338883.1 DUF1302 domain-containing protein [Gammaproteobacteria bacterium]
MNIRRFFLALSSGCVLAVTALTAAAWNSRDGTLTIHGFLDNTYHHRADYGITKERVRGQVEWSKIFKPTGLFSELSFHGTLRASYDGVYDLNDDTYGKRSGGSVTTTSSGSGAYLPVAIGPNAQPQLTNVTVALGGTAVDAPWGASPVSAGVPALPGGGGFGFDTTVNPNEGLKRVGGELAATNNDGEFGGGLEFFTPTRPCDVDARGCIPGYMDATLDDLRFPEFTDDHGWLREIYIDATMPVNNGDEINFRIGRQQVVWGRTDLFRVLDQVNPIDFSIQSIYEEFEDSRIPLGIFSAEYRAGAVGAFDDLNLQVIWNFEKFRPNHLGQGGQPYNILLAGDLFRALKNCWDNGCTINNFAGGLAPDGNLATDFPRHVVGIRDIHKPGWDFDQGGIRLEGVFRSVGFSLNAMTFYSQLPSLRGAIEGVNPFLGDLIPPQGCPPSTPAPGLWSPAFSACPATPAFLPDGPRVELPRQYVPAFDIYFPRVTLVGGSADFYVDPLKSAFRVELAHTSGEEFADTSVADLNSESDVIRWVVGWDRPTYIRWLNPNRTFLLSAQIFGQHLLDHKSISHPISGRQIGFQDWKNGYIGTFLFQGFFRNDRLLPRIITAYDFRAKAAVLAPGVDYLINDNLRLIFGANIKLGRGPQVADDGRTTNAFPPFTARAGCTEATISSSCGDRRGFEPLGRFRSGPLGMAQHEDEFQVLLRYRF